MTALLQIRSRGRVLFAALTRMAPDRARSLLASMDSGAQKQLAQPHLHDAQGETPAWPRLHVSCHPVQMAVICLCSRVGGRARQLQSRAASAAVPAQTAKQPGASGGAVRLVASASGVRQDGSHPFIPVRGSLPEPQPTPIHSQPEPAYRRPEGPTDAFPSADANRSAPQRSQQESTDSRPPRPRPNSRRSIGGAALRVLQPDAPAADVRAAASTNVLALPDVAGDQASFSMRPPKPRRTSSLSLASSRGPFGSGADRMQAVQPVARPSALGGANRTSTHAGARAHRTALRHPLLSQMVQEHMTQ